MLVPLLRALLQPQGPQHGDNQNQQNTASVDQNVVHLEPPVQPGCNAEENDRNRQTYYCMVQRSRIVVVTQQEVEQTAEQRSDTDVLQNRHKERYESLHTGRPSE